MAVAWRPDGCGKEKVLNMNMKKVAVLADMHLPERTDTVKEPVFDWALAEAKRRGYSMPDLINEDSLAMIYDKLSFSSESEMYE